MSDSLATGASYAEDFHSSTGISNSDRSLRAAAEQTDSSETDEHPDDAAVSYRYHDEPHKRLICIYAPTLLFRGEENGESADDAEAHLGVLLGAPAQPLLTARSRRSTANQASVSYSSSFEATTTGTGTVTNSRSARRTRTESRRSASEDSSSSSNCDGLNGTMSRLRIMSIEELTAANAEVQAEYRFLDDAHERLARTARSESSFESTSPPALLPKTKSSALQPSEAFVDAQSAEATARALLRRLRSKPFKPAVDSHHHPNSYFPILPTTIGLEVPRLTVEQLLVDSLRRGGRVLTSAAMHNPARCEKCQAVRQRLDQAEWLRGLTRRVRRGTTEQRLLQHDPASVMSRQMLNVAQNARLVSEWMQTGRVPPIRGLS